MKTKERKEILDMLVTDYGIVLSFGETAKVLGIHYNRVPEILCKAGITVKPIGKYKKVLASSLATFLVSEHVSPISKT